MLPIPIGTDRPRRRFPWMNVLIIGANVVCYVLSHQSGGPHAPASIAGLAPGWDKWMLYPTHPALAQFITYQFLHENFTHILFNMLFLWVFGNNLNEKLGNIAYLLFYLTGGVLAGCGQLLTSSAPTLGASGAISAVTGLFFVLLPRTNIRMFIFFFVYVDVWEIPSMYFILFKVGQDVIEPLLGPSNVAHMAHISGTAAGVVIGLVLLLGGLVQRDHYDLLAMINRYRRRKQYESLVSHGYDPFAAAGGGKGSPGLPVAPVHENPRVAALRDEITMLIRNHQLPEAAGKYIELRALDPRQILTPQDQLDIANQLMSEQRYSVAAAAYEDYLRAYPKRPQHEQITLVLALIYIRYAPNPTRARDLLTGILPHLHNAQERDLAESELAQLAAAPGGDTFPPSTQPA
ncbi:MAG TPA: rhomboid family intramembrane serine protease [Phycisphaerae bacterium]|nr:rhomboid family intramembrane serine protease [Phycisphaerae bacterium]